MRERDLQRATELFAQIQSVQGDMGSHDAFGKHLRLFFELEHSTTSLDGWADVAKALDLNHDELHMRTNLLIRAMLDEKMTNVKAELRKLGVKLEDEVPPEPKEKKSKKQLRITGPAGTDMKKNGGD